MTVLKIGEMEKKLFGASLMALKNAYVLWGVKVGAAVFAEMERFTRVATSKAGCQDWAPAPRGVQQTTLFCMEIERSRSWQ